MFTDCLKFGSSVGHAITEQIVAEQHNHFVSVWSVTFDGTKSDFVGMEKSTNKIC